MCRLFGELPCCVRLCEGLLCVGRCKWRKVWPQLGLGYVSGKKMFILWFPMCWAYRNFKVCVICASDFPKVSRSGLRVFDRFAH